MIGAEFLGMILLIVYVGAVAVLFLFVVMMLNVAEQKQSWFIGQKSNHIPSGLIVSILIIQILAMLGAQMTSKASKKYGNIKTLIAINSVWAAMSIYAYFMISPVQFYVAAGIVGLVMGGIQALSRSTYSKYLPRTEDTASYFSFYDVAEKIGIVIGMLLYGFIDQITGSMRNSVLFLIVFFISGIVLLLRVPDKIKS